MKTGSIALARMCPYRKSNPDVLVMQSPEDRQSFDPSGCLDSSSARSVLGKRQMRADVIVVGGITAERMPKMPLPKHDDVVKAFPPHRSNQALRAAVLPWRTGCCRVIADAQQSNSPHEYRSIAGIAVTDQKPGRPLPATGFHELICKPFRRRMYRDAKPQDLPPAVPHDQQSIEKAERAGRHHKQIHRGDAIRVIAQKRLPTLCRRPPPPHHVLRHARLSDAIPSLSSSP